MKDTAATARPALCSICHKLPFTTWRFALNREWRLGRFGQVRSRSCAFCEIVTALCLNYPTSCAGIPLTDAAVITVQFFLNYGFAANHALVGSYICPVTQSDMPDILRDEQRSFVRGVLPSFVDFNEVRRWIANCDREHAATCNSRASYNPELLPRNSNRQLDLRLIDTRFMCLVYAARNCEYVALSYVWGSRAQNRLALTTDNEDALMENGVLARPEVQSMMPQTIQDAVHVARDLGQRYLWVDSLCLLQDDEDELSECIAIMDAFYAMATFTIVAADGDAWSGLPGVEPNTRLISPIVRNVAPGVTLTVASDMETKLQRSVYSSRAWTMQEETLSNRLLVFVDGQVFFQCREGSCSEVRNWPGRALHLDRKGTGYSQVFDSSSSTFADFATLVKYYMSRELSFTEDVHRAAQGMLRKFSILSEVHCVEGLAAPIDRSLLFKASQRRFSRAFGRREGFPSYSWTGWYSSPHYDLYSGLGSSNLPMMGPMFWIKWFCKRTDGKLCSIDKAGRMRKSQPPLARDSLKHAPVTLRTVPVNATDIDIASIPSIPYTQLFFWTVCINLSLIESWEHEGCYGARLSDRDGKPCGAVDLDTMMPDTQGSFALIAYANMTFFAIMIRWHGKVAERCGLAQLQKSVLERSLSPGPLWEPIVLQ